MSFLEILRSASNENNSLVCVGLDSDPSKLPAHLATEEDGVLRFNKTIVQSTSDLVCAYKPNSAFYEAAGAKGIESLRKTCEMIPSHIPVILDVKRGDIGNTASMYAEYAYDIIGADAVTINPYMGFDAVRPFLRDGKCVFILCLTSNPSASDFQFASDDGVMLFERIAKAAVEWSQEGEIGLVVGATRPEHMNRIREIAGDLPFLVPGIGAQGGDAQSVIAGSGGEGGQTVINSSRGIIFASNGVDYGEAARESLLELRNRINGFRRQAT